MSAWQVYYQMMIFIAGLNAIPTEQYEAMCGRSRLVCKKLIYVSVILGLIKQSVCNFDSH